MNLPKNLYNSYNIGYLIQKSGHHVCVPNPHPYKL